MGLGEFEFAESDNDIDAVVIDHDDISNYNPEQILPQTPEVIQKIRSWLKPTTYDVVGGEYRKHLVSHAAGTGAWLTSSANYREWLQGDKHGLLWIKGIPGSGKSVMAANLIDEITKSHPGSPVLFFFFRQIIEANHKPNALLQDWMDQLLHYSPPLQKQLKKYMDNNRTIDSLSMDDMWKDLRMAFAGVTGRLFCVADALDEIDQGHESFLQALGALGQWRPSKVKVLITSRPVAKVELPLRKTPCLHIRLEENLVDADISTFVQLALSNSSIPRKEWQVIADAVPGRANGLFLYAKLAMDAFLEPGADIHKVLLQLPADLNVLYTDLLKEHARRSGVSESIQYLILQSVTHAARPLRLLELAEMMKANSPDHERRDLKTTKDLIRAACGPLLEILADETVSVVHHSFTEYLKGTTRTDDSIGYPILQMGSSHAQLAIACLRYLQSGCLDAIQVKFSDVEPKNKNLDDYSLPFHDEDYIEESEVKLRLNHPFFDYAASNWHHHINKSEVAGFDQSEVNTELRKFLGVNTSMKAWLQIKWPGAERCAALVTQIHIAAKTGLISYTMELLKTMEVDALDIQIRTPLWWAASEGHSRVIQMLIAAGANPDQDEDRGRKPLHEAAGKNHSEAVKILLEAGVDPLTPKSREEPGMRCGNAPTSVGHTPLMYACHNGHSETVEVFLPFLKSLDDVHRALAWGAERGNLEVVATVLRHPGVDVNAKVRNATPLFRACGVPDAAAITYLLQAGADPNIECADHGIEFGGFCSYSTNPPRQNCLQYLCDKKAKGRSGPELEENLQKAFLLLVEAGAQISANMLHGAVHSPVLTRLLLDAGADANATDNSGAAPLHKVQNLDSLQLLVEHGHANIDLPQADGKTPLLCLLSSHRTDTVLKFLEYGPNCDLFDNQGNGALHTSLQQGSSVPAVIEALLKAGANPNQRNREGLTPLLTMRKTMSSSRSEESIDLLLKAGADINARDRNGASLFFNLISSWRTSSRIGNVDAHKYFKFLIERGASTSTRDSSGRTCLHEAVRAYEQTMVPGDNSTRFGFLVDLGLDIKAVDNHGNGLLHELALHIVKTASYSWPKSVYMWEKLVAMGLDLEQRNSSGRTPLHILCTADTRNSQFKLGDTTPIDFVISRSKSLDIADNYGITPLHIAVTGSEAYAKKLLDAGANPSVSTDEGLTPLHIASRCRESNIVGLLLQALKEKAEENTVTVDNCSQNEESDEVLSKVTESSSKPVAGVNAKTFQDNITPLFYACRSGRPETVALLLDAGADPNVGNMLEACAGFEKEDGLWKIPRLEDLHGNGSSVALLKNDETRPSRIQQNPHNNEIEYTRLDEIMNMLVKFGFDFSKLDSGGQMRVSGPKPVSDIADYTYALLDKISDIPELNIPDTARNLYTGHRVFKPIRDSLKEASIRSLRDSGVVKPGISNAMLLARFLERREYHLVEELASLGATFVPDKERQYLESHFATLVRHGFAWLIDRIVEIKENARVKERSRQAFGDKTQSALEFAKPNPSETGFSTQNFGPLLIEAVRRQLPNMDVVRLLVEKFQVDINDMPYNMQHANHGRQPAATGTSLHQVARGGSWWHVHQALPYLLRAGADIGLRDEHGQTPLHMALPSFGKYPGPFGKDAAKMLIEAGADVNAVDRQGQSCLARAEHDLDLIRLMVRRGAKITAASLFAAIEGRNVAVLRELLSGGIDANIRRDKVINAGSSALSGKVEAHEKFPLYCAAENLLAPSRIAPERLRHRDANFQLVQALLEHGANPYAKFLGRIHGSAGVDSTDTQSVEVPEGYEECTLLHEFFINGNLTASLADLPGLDVDHRDAKGRTLLLAACSGQLGPDHSLSPCKDGTNESESLPIFQKLISLGADPLARDNHGRNAIHLMIGGRIQLTQFRDSLNYLISKTDLVHQADHDGKTPLHYAMSRITFDSTAEVAELLLSAGADPLAIDNDGDSFLHVLARNLERPVAQTLFRDMAERGVNVNGRNNKGETPLFAFCDRPKTSRRFAGFSSLFDNNPDRISPSAAAWALLEELGADCFVRDSQGRGLLHVAARGDVERFEKLLAKGVDPMLEDDAQQTAVDVAAARGNQGILGLFEKKD